MKKESGVGTRSYQHVDVITMVLMVCMFIIPVSFFFLLDQQAGVGFGLSEILFSIAFAIIVSLFLMWVKAIIIKNPYLGVVIGLIAIGTFSYSLRFVFTGLYTTVFAIVTNIIVLVYWGFYFFRYRSQEKHNVDDFDDSI